MYEYVQRKPEKGKQCNKKVHKSPMMKMPMSSSGLFMNDVQIHYNSDKADKAKALASKGNEAYMESGQERCLGHEPGDVKAYTASAEENSGIHIIQRKIGFEFQTNCRVARGNIDEHNKLAKGEKIIGGSLVDVTADDSDNAAFSDVEFVTEPLENYAQIESVWGEIGGMKHRFIAQDEKKDQWVDFEGGLVVNRPEKDLRAAPQVTFGIPLSEIFELAQAAIVVNPDLRDDLSRVKNPEGSNFKGLIELIKSYIATSLGLKELYKVIYGGGKKLEYPKIITDGFLLSRTDFGTLFCHYRDESGALETIEEWLEIFEKAFESSEVFTEYGGLDANLFPDVEEGSNEGCEFTIREWLTFLYEDSHHDKILDVRDRESMGTMGLDQVKNYKSGTEVGVGVFEMRANQGVAHYLTENPTWLEFMNHWYSTIEKTGYLPPSGLLGPPPE